MENKVKKAFVKLIESGVTGKKAELSEELTEKDFSALFSLAKKHEAAALVGFAITDSGINIGKSESAFFAEQTKCLFIYETQKHDLERLSELFEQEKVSFMPIKGAVIKELYAAPETRYSCDVDILIKKCDYKRAISALKKAGYNLSDGAKKVKDVSAVSEGGTVFDLHSVFSVTDENSITDVIWESATSDKNNPYLYHASAEAIACYTADHAARHFVGGGCGIKTVADFIAIKNRLNPNQSVLDDLLEKTGNKKFYDGIYRLIEAWDNGTENEFTKNFGDYILDGGVFGTFEQSAAMESAGNKHYVLRKIFVPKKELEKSFPILNKKPYLLPFLEVKRWLCFFSKKRRKIAETKIKAANDTELVKRAEYLKKELGV